MQAYPTISVYKMVFQTEEHKVSRKTKDALIPFGGRMFFFCFKCFRLIFPYTEALREIMQAYPTI
jgi:hypothetical protein